MTSKLRMSPPTRPSAVATAPRAPGRWWLGRRYEFGIIPDRGTTRPADAPTAERYSGSGGPGSGGTGTATRTASRTSMLSAPTIRSTLPRWASILIAVLTVAVALVNVIQLYRIGDAGAQAVWTGVVSNG